LKSERGERDFVLSVTDAPSTGLRYLSFLYFCNIATRIMGIRKGSIKLLALSVKCRLETQDAFEIWIGCFGVLVVVPFDQINFPLRAMIRKTASSP